MWQNYVRSLTQGSAAVCYLAMVLCCGDFQLQAEETVSWSSVLKSISSERSKLISGRVTASGHETATSQDPIPVQMEWLFDQSQGAVAYSRKLTVSENPAKSVQHAVWSFPDRRIFYSDFGKQPQANVEGKNEIRSRGLLGSAGFFDLRAVGLVSHHQLYKCVQLEEVIKNLSANKNVRVLEGGTIEVQWSPVDGFHRFTMYVNPQRGFTIERVVTENGVTRDGTFTLLSEVATPEQRAKLESQGVKPAATFPDIAQELTLKWHQRTDVWVPVHMAFQATEPAHKIKSQEPGVSPIGANHYQLKLDLEWAEINSPISEKRFSPAEFGLPDLVATVDRRVDSSSNRGGVAEPNNSAN